MLPFNCFILSGQRLNHPARPGPLFCFGDQIAFIQATHMANVKIYLYFILFGFSGCCYAQVTQPVRGIVVDSATLNALPSVNVQIKNGTGGTTTDEKGNFIIDARESDTLVFSLVGYERLELPLAGYEPGIIRMSEKYTMLQAVTIDEYRAGDLYEGMFDEQNAQLKKRIPFYFSKAKKEKIKVQSLREENLRVQTYVDVVVNDPGFKQGIMKRYALTEPEYYDLLTTFNERHHRVMYYLTRAELISMLNTFFDSHTR